LKARLYLSCVLVLVIGLSISALVYVIAVDDAETGHVFYDDPHLSKKYVRELQRYGGRAAVMIDEIDRWFASLWRGKALGVTLAWISVVVALALFLFARWLPPDNPA
jgi:hypothetical protein